MSLFFDLDEDVIYHYGTKYHSGRYPYGTGENPYQHDPHGYLKHVQALRKEGFTDSQIAKGMDMTTTQLRARFQIAREWQRAQDMKKCRELSEQGMPNTKIAEQLGWSEATVRNYLKGVTEEKNNVTRNVADTLRKNVDKYGYVDVGDGVSNGLGVTKNRLSVAVAMLEDEGYVSLPVQIEQMGTGYKTNMKVLCKEGTTYKDLVNNKQNIHVCDEISTDNGHTFTPKFLDKPVSVDSKRIQIRYAEQGGTDRDGLIELRRGVEDIALGNKDYAQVRIAVDGTHYLKGMAVYSDNLPPGVDIRFNTNKHEGTPKTEVFKEMKEDPLTKNPFGSMVTQYKYTGKDGKEHQSAINLVNEEGDWTAWSRDLAAQFLSKQPVTLAKKQLNLAYSEKKQEFEEIKSLTNPAVREMLMEKFADDCDGAAVHMKAAALPRQAWHVILPVPSLKENEIYAPNYNDGEVLALVRYPHGGTFEIPMLKVNNSNKEATKMMGKNAPDAVGINPRAATQLSGADFDGDTVIVLPTKNVKINAKHPFKELQEFDPKEEYKAYPGMPKMTEKQKGTEMGKITNLIMDMTLAGADDDELVRATKHSMVVIDAYKHNLDYKRSAHDNRIAELKEKYQGGKNAGAGTLITRSTARQDVRARKLRTGIDPETGEKIYYETGEHYTKTRTLKNGEVRTTEVYPTQQSKKMAETKDARTLYSDPNNPYPMEVVYATYANQMKALANDARKEVLAARANPVKKDSSASKAYAEEVKSLNSKLNTALSHSPAERQAQILAGHQTELMKAANPDASADDIKKFRGKSLAIARERYGGAKQQVKLTDREWEAIQAGAISSTTLKSILNNTDLDRVKELATPRTSKNAVTNAKLSRINAMKAAGYTNNEIAKALGISASTVSSVVNEKTHRQIAKEAKKVV